MDILYNISLRDKNWFKTGGNAEYYCEPTDTNDFKKALKFAEKNRLKLFILGMGANVLISDNGFKGLIVHPKILYIKPKLLGSNYVSLEVGAGVSMHDLINYCMSENLLGLEEFSGIPASIGGAVFINLHYFEYSLRDFLIKAKVIEKMTGEMKEVDRNWFKFDYDASKLQDNKYFLISATFKLKKAGNIETAYAKGRRSEIIKHRVKRYPIKNTCGCFFKNFRSDEVSLESYGRKIIYISYYLDKLGVKGELSVGDAVVSYQHANMIVNKGKASSKDIITLARRMQELVKSKFNLIPQPECVLVGFEKYPLLNA